MSEPNHTAASAPAHLPSTASDRAVKSYLWDVAELLRGLPPEPISRFAGELLAARRRGATVFTFGNGGSAATALHLANDLARAAHGEDSGLRTVCLCGNASSVTCLANDHGYDQIFCRQLESLLRPGDVLLGVSASGNSPNCVEAMRRGRQSGAVNLALLGFGGGRMQALVDCFVHVPCDDYRRVEDVHLSICHALTEILETS